VSFASNRQHIPFSSTEVSSPSDYFFFAGLSPVVEGIRVAMSFFFLRKHFRSGLRAFRLRCHPREMASLLSSISLDGGAFLFFYGLSIFSFSPFCIEMFFRISGYLAVSGFTRMRWMFFMGMPAAALFSPRVSGAVLLPPPGLFPLCDKCFSFFSPKNSGWLPRDPSGCREQQNLRFFLWQ